MNNPNTKYVVVFNRDIDFGTPVRNIITYCDYDCEANFWAWYYTEFVPRDGDKMKVFDTRKEAHSFARKIEEDE